MLYTKLPNSIYLSNMDTDFNPFDLSAHRPNIDPTKDEQKETDKSRPKPTVHRVSMGPLFHSRITRIIAFILGLILAGLLGYTGMNYYLNKKAESNTKVTNSTEKTESGSSEGSNVDASETDAKQATPEAQADTGGGTPSTAPSSAQPQTKTYCGVSGMPEGVCTTITSIEKDGLKGNKYVFADTSQLPSGVVIDVNEKSWNQGGPNNGSVEFTGKVQGKTYNGTAFLQNSNGTWQVISYTLN